MVTRKTYAATEEHLSQLADLARWWGILQPASDSAVLREAVHRAWAIESKMQQQTMTPNRRNRRQEQ